MSAVAETFRPNRRLALAIVPGAVILMIAVALAIPNLHRSRVNADLASLVAFERTNGIDNVALLADAHSPTPIAAKLDAAPDTTRKTTRTTTIELLVKNPAESAEQVRELAEGMGGYLVSSELRGNDAPYASIIVRVPAARFDEARAQIKKIAARVETEAIQANDVTRDYVDLQARLRNLRAQEMQYLEIMKRATTVDETLKVSEKLGDVRSQIEQQQAEFNALSKQVETVALTVSLRREGDAEVFGLHWRPLHRIKVAAHDALEALADYAGIMTTVVLFLPAAFLWTATVLLAALIGWRLLRWASRFFISTKVPATQA